MDIFKVKFSTEIDTADVYKIFSKNYSQSITEFLEFQRTWMNRAYLTFNDLDKYLIFMSLISRIFKSYSEYFIMYNFDEFYSIDEYELKKFNIVNISKELDIRKETARRKILELEKTGFIKKNKKAISIIRSANSIEKPTNSIASLSSLVGKSTNSSKMFCLSTVLFWTFKALTISNILL